MSGPDVPGEVGELHHLDRARLLARRGWGRVHPNPLVGCVIVRDGVVVGEGHHADLGGPHAEIVALEAARDAARGATAFVTLEPCNHYGRTPPCSLALVDAGVKRVVFGALDPGVDSGGGAETLRRAGIEVVGPVWDDTTARAENPAFFHAARRGTPYVALKLAMTLDARIAGAPGANTRISGPEAQTEVHRLRSGFDAIMVGAGTARADDPRLTVRSVPRGRTPPRRIVLDASAGLSSEAALFADRDEAPVHVFTRRAAPEADMERLERCGAHVHPVSPGPGGLDLEEVFRVCWETGIRSILCEGGARLGASLLRAERVQRFYLFLAPFTLGRGGVPAFPDDAARIRQETFRLACPPERHGPDVLLILDHEEE